MVPPRLGTVILVVGTGPELDQASFAGVGPCFKDDYTPFGLEEARQLNRLRHPIHRMPGWELVCLT